MMAWAQRKLPMPCELKDFEGVFQAITDRCLHPGRKRRPCSAGHKRAKRPSRERPRRCAAEQRKELAPFQVSKLHPLPTEGAHESIVDRRRLIQRLATARNFVPANAGFGTNAPELSLQ
jgi:hypothetical protein